MMVNLILMIAVVGYVVSGILAYALHFAYNQREFTLIADEMYREDMGVSIAFAVFGPLALFIIFFMTGMGKHGLKFK